MATASTLVRAYRPTYRLASRQISLTSIHSGTQPSTGRKSCGTPLSDPVCPVMCHSPGLYEKGAGGPAYGAARFRSIFAAPTRRRTEAPPTLTVFRGSHTVARQLDDGRLCESDRRARGRFESQ